MKLKDIGGLRFGRLTAIKDAGKTKHGAVAWLFLCDCGRNKIFARYEVIKGVCSSCGCAKKERNKKHGMSRTKEYNTWCRIISRCYNIKNNSYFRYGGRGIKVSVEWKNSFDVFLKDMGTAPSKCHSIDRINNNGDYKKDNCMWATPKEQSRNRSSNVLLEINGEKKCLIEWCEYFGIKWNTFKTRRRRGASCNDIFLSQKNNKT